MRQLPIILITLAALMLASCGATETATPTSEPTAAATEEATPTEEIVQATEEATEEATAAPTEEIPDAASSLATGEAIFFGFTHQHRDGNRLMAGQGNLPELQHLDIPLAGEPLWVVGAPFGTAGDTVWVVALADGQTQAFHVGAGAQSLEELAVAPLAAGQPPLLRVEGDSISLVTAPIEGASLETTPLPIGDEAIVFIDGADLVFWEEGTETGRIEGINPLPDARLLADDQGRLLLLTQPTDSYLHAVLGDGLEAAGVALIDIEARAVIQTIELPDPPVIEGIAPLWADLNRDGEREIIVTQSDAAQGAQIIAFNAAGEQVAAGPAIGMGNRWRHQLAVAPFGPNGEVELVDVLTPHIGGTVEFYQMNGGELEIVGRVTGYTSHLLGSRNLDMAVAGDFDGDGQVELLLPSQDRLTLGAIHRTPDGAAVDWTLSLDNGRLLTNISAVTLPSNNTVGIGLGLEGARLRLWVP